ncbi:signal transduction histidine kinase [Variovorax boronicumulans]|uniref:ATP-binding protein n=1 Tax=Variovorax boronicumulans TaxID=436515 RepID=UPI00278475C3|nr:ATP-binding protein [Variovorax boronicumulans]MDP9916734.1 signal transduction histidine kinase [Variovorax boronicumulans]
MAAFTVDTKLFQELGELLVAKESTALTELIKNSYDADATVVTVHGSNLKDGAKGSIAVTDDGSGMAQADFENGFLRIAGRTKVASDRRSLVFGRRFTGEKGVGRLAAHKLARRLAIRSSKAQHAERGAEVLPAAIETVVASIDWDAIEALETLDQVPASNAVLVKVEKQTKGKSIPSGTSLLMTPLRRGWTQRTIESFLKEAVTLAPTPVLWDKLPEDIVTEPLLFKKVPVRDQLKDPGFRIQFSGDLAVPDVFSPDIAASAGWIAEIDFERKTGLLRVAIAPTKATHLKFKDSAGFRFEQHLGKESGPTFRARILQRSNTVWDPVVQGIRVFMEGFRVPPYGDATDDWLGLDRDYKSRARRRLTSLDRIEAPDLPEANETEELVLQGSSAYMGAVFLQRSSSPELQMLVNREGFLAGPGLDFVTEWVRVTTDLIVRLGHSVRRDVKEVKRVDRERQEAIAKRADVGESPSALRVRESAQAAASQLDIVQAAIKSGDLKKAAAAAKAAQPHVAEVSALSEEFGSEAVMWRVLASLGTELAAFVHEINALALEASGIVADLDDAIPNVTTPAALSKIRRARKSALELADRIRRNAIFLVDSTSFQGRRRRSRLPLRERFDAVVPFFATRIKQKAIVLENAIGVDLRTPPMFPAELAGIFTNLVSNAVKFTEKGGRIRTHATLSKGVMAVTVENTGMHVDIAKSMRLFEAFHSTTERPDAVLGQGMGMGLTITRAFVQEYGGTIEFVKPSPDFATAIRFEVPVR